MQKKGADREHISLFPSAGLKCWFVGSTPASRMSMPDFSSVAARICGSCGMCCNGVMFHLVKLQPGDSPKMLAALGLKVKRKRKQDCILQPCPAHDGCRCAIYESRPVRCRVFECRQLHRLAAGTISEAEALQKTSEAKILVSEINSLLLRLGATNSKQPLVMRCKSVESGFSDSTSDEIAMNIRSQLARAIDDLEVLLDRHFRIEPAGLPD